MTSPGPISLSPEDNQVSQALIDAYAESWQRINDAQMSLANDPLNARKRARLQELSAMVSREIAALDGTAKQYAAENFPKVYYSAVSRASWAVDPKALAYVQPNREAAQLLADGLERQLLEATEHVDATTKQLIRKIGRDAGLKTAIDGKTAKQAATEMRRILQESGIHSVTYANGAKVGLKTYAEMAIRTSTALALNQGVLQGAEDAGCLFWEVFDGPSCGWTKHNDGDLANGKIVPRDEVRAHPISHPNCRRSFGPRPDLGVNESKRQKSTDPVTTQDQVAQTAGGGTPPRAARAQDRAAKAQQRAGTQSPTTRDLPSTASADEAKVYPEYLFELAKTDKRFRASPSTPGDLSAPKARMRQRLNRGDFDQDTAPEYDLLTWAYKQAADEGFGDDLSVPVSVLSRSNQSRVIRYLADGGELPAKPDLKTGTRAADVLNVYPKTDETEFERFTPEEWDRLWGTESLPPAQAKALRSYSRGGDGPTNRALRKGGGDGPKVNAIRAAMRPVPKSVQVTRGVDIDAFGYRFPLDSGGGDLRDNEAEAQWLAGLVGQEFRDPGFLSTTIDKEAFAADVDLIIDIPEGYRAAWVQQYSSSPGEHELLLDRGTRLEIYDVQVTQQPPRGSIQGQIRHGRLVTMRARVVHQDGAYQYDPKLAADARAGKQTKPPVLED